MKHFGIYSDSSELEQAYQNGDIINPYVALVSGSLDYDTQQPCLIGKWRNNGGDSYSFQNLDTGDTAWTNGVNIGQLVGVYFNGDQLNMDVLIQFDGSYTWSIYFVPEGGDPSDGESYSFIEGNQDTWTSSTMTDPDASNSPVVVTWDGTDTFMFSATQDYPLSMTTINPECSEEGPSE